MSSRINDVDKKVLYVLTSLITLVIVMVATVYFFPQQQSPPSTLGVHNIGTRTKTSGCVAHDGLPDKDCTPGAIFAEATKEQICTPGYSKSVRNVSERTKTIVFAEYGIATHSAGEYEVDHLISLELGGSNDVANLWPEAAEPRPGFHEKDRIENILHDEVCNGVITLQQAQQIIADNWEAVSP